jgi:primosomal protein N'
MKSHNTELRFVICIKNEDCEDLELRKIYQVLSDEDAAEDNYLRIIDESGEDYLYPADYFVEIQLPQAIEKSVLLASR